MLFSSDKSIYKWPDLAGMPKQFKVRIGPDGILLFNRETGVNLLIDEVKVPKELWFAAPRHVSIALTNACDLDCAHCFAPKYPAKLDVDHLNTWLDELDANGCIGVGFGGGEPTLYPDLARVCQYAFKNTGLAVTFTTHGHHINNQLAAALKGNVHFIRVSMDGVGATYEKIRKKSFPSLLCQLVLIRDIAPFGINYLVNEITLSDLDDAVALAAEHCASEFLLIPEQPVHERGGIDQRTMQELRKWVYSYQGVIPLRISELASGGLPICNPFTHETGLSAYAHIDATAILKRSSLDKDGVTIGSEGVLHALSMLESTQEASL
jgi:MoaA/NifB/PqqE/SkfB family radical SAM enzyme